MTGQTAAERIEQLKAENAALRQRRDAVSALPLLWGSDEDDDVAHLLACGDFGCKTCVVIACAADLRGALDPEAGGS